MQRSLYKSTDKKIIGGVCAGLGEYFNIDINIVRLLFVLLALTGGQMIIVYILGWIIIPSKKEDTITDDETASTEIEKQKGNNRNLLFGVVLVILGGGFLLENLHLWFWWDFGKLWPVLIIALGILILTRAFSRKEVLYEGK